MTQGDIAHRVVTVVAFSAMTLALTIGAATAQVATTEADFSGYAAGTVIHVHAVEVGDPGDDAIRLLNADVAFSGASVDSQGVVEARSNELGMRIDRADPDLRSFGRGAGIELTIGGEVPDGVSDVQIAGLAEAAAPPSTDLLTEEIGPVPGDPLLWASLARAQAQALWPDDVCPDPHFGLGLGQVADVQLLDTAAAGASEEQGAGESDEDGLGLLDDAGSEQDDAADVEAQQDDGDGLGSPFIGTVAADPDRRVVWSTSRMLLGAQVDADGEPLGDAHSLVSEVRQTIAPVTLLGGTPLEFTIEVLGEWVLRATASGLPGGAHIHYGPGEVSPETPVLRVIQEGEILGQLALQDLLGEDGLDIPLGDEELGFLARITVGEAPRAIGGPHGSEPEIADDGTHASAAVDAVRVSLLEVPGSAQVAEVRIGHMEVEAIVPPGGLICPPDEPLRPPTPVTGGIPLALLLGLGLVGAAFVLRRHSAG